MYRKRFILIIWRNYRNSVLTMCREVFTQFPAKSRFFFYFFGITEVCLQKIIIFFCLLFTQSRCMTNLCFGEKRDFWKSKKLADSAAIRRYKYIVRIGWWKAELKGSQSSNLSPSPAENVDETVRKFRFWSDFDKKNWTKSGGKKFPVLSHIFTLIFGKKGEKFPTVLFSLWQKSFWYFFRQKICWNYKMASRNFQKKSKIYQNKRISHIFFRVSTFQRVNVTSSL